MRAVTNSLLLLKCKEFNNGSYPSPAHFVVDCRLALAKTKSEDPIFRAIDTNISYLYLNPPIPKIRMLMSSIRIRTNPDPDKPYKPVSIIFRLDGTSFSVTDYL